MQHQVYVMMILQVFILLLLGTASAANISLPGCQDKCGNVSIPYPFGVGAGCYLDAGFEIICDDSYPTPKAFTNGNTQVDEILPDHVRAHYWYISYQCYDETDWTNASTAWFNLTQVPAFRFSDTRNKFTAIGCATLAYIFGNGGRVNGYTSGCLSFCNTPGSATNGSCSGMGCCQTSIPKDLFYFNVSFGGYNHSDVWEFSPCSYGLLVEQDWYNFTASDLSGFDFYHKNNITGFPVVLDWAIRDMSCSEAKLQTGYACRSEKSDCYDSTNGPGYLCKCSGGYEGNPYLEHGCTDIDECRDPDLYPCFGNCTNKPGGYDCKCPPGTQGNATYERCSKIPEKFPLAAKLSVGISAGVIIMLSLSCLLIIKLQKRKYLREKDDYFKQNGGLILYERLRARQVETVRVFTEKELEKVTNNFANERILGAGGRGTVYKGILENSREVAIKRSKEVDESQKDEFVNEIIILSQINHRSIVKLLGCCLEVEVPVLIYEFVPNGTLFDFLHGKNRTSAIPLDIRLEIATDSANALSYLHSSTERSIIHGDVKSLNILLDANYKAKVSDFGASTLVPLDKDQFVMLVQGTRGYLDPECLTTQQLTEKSDVYSFGVVLTELITRKQAIYTDGSNETKCLAFSFVSMMDQGRLRDILDDQIADEGVMELLQEVAELAVRCLSVKREERPTMKEVADGLHVLTRSKHHPWSQKNPEETESLLGEMSTHTTASDSTAYNSMVNRLVLNIDDGR
ncbi:wall-associated receptor kinase 3-like [Typha angustifolia]|uniref:wall-associated receptor kinase 3-like n=1 Tax=Typha angustifolia TaxID=59011 RepID=UPI003C2C8D7D